MTIFLILAIYLVFLSLVIPESKKMKKSIWAALGFVLVLSFRAPFCGLDVIGSVYGITNASYAGVFFSMSQFSFWDILTNSASVSGHFEVGWLLLTKIISLFTGNLQVYLTIIAILQFIPIAYIIGKYSNNIILSYFIFAGFGFYIHFFSGIRQSLAISIILLAFDQLYDKKYLRFVVITILASTLHRSALLFILMWPLSRIKLTFNTSAILVIFMVLLMPFYRTIVSVILNVFFSGGYSRYLKGEGQALTMFVVYALLFLASFINKENSRFLNLLRILLLLGVAGQSLGALGGGAITRIGFYYNVFFILLFPKTLESIKGQKDRTTISVISIFLLCLFFVLTTPPGHGSSYVIPYDFFWNYSVFL